MAAPAQEFMPMRVFDRTLAVLLAGAVAAGQLAGCAVVDMAVPGGCSRHWVFFGQPFDAGRLAGAGAVHVRARQLGVFATGSPVGRFGVGWLDESWVAVNPSRVQAMVDAQAVGQTMQQVRIVISERDSKLMEAGDERTEMVVCAFGNDRIERMHSP